MKTIIIRYTSETGKIYTKIFHDEDKALEFSFKLDKRIEKHTCGGYIITEYSK